VFDRWRLHESDIQVQGNQQTISPQSPRSFWPAASISLRQARKIVGPGDEYDQGSSQVYLSRCHVACVASVSVRFGSKELQRENEASERGGRGRGRKEGNACRQTPGF